MSEKERGPCLWDEGQGAEPMCSEVASNCRVFAQRPSPIVPRQRHLARANSRPLRSFFAAHRRSDRVAAGCPRRVVAGPGCSSWDPAGSGSANRSVGRRLACRRRVEVRTRRCLVQHVGERSGTRFHRERRSRLVGVDVRRRGAVVALSRNRSPEGMQPESDVTRYSLESMEAVSDAEPVLVNLRLQIPLSGPEGMPEAQQMSRPHCKSTERCVQLLARRVAATQSHASRRANQLQRDVGWALVQLDRGHLSRRKSSKAAFLFSFCLRVRDQLRCLWRPAELVSGLNPRRACRCLGSRAGLG